MIKGFGWSILNKRSLPSPFGWPVPDAVKLARPEEMRRLVAFAERNGFSRIGKGIKADREDCLYVIVPYHPESSPVASWMCYAMEVPRSLSRNKKWKEYTGMIYRLDVRVEDFNDLDLVKRREKNQVIHTIMWVCARASYRKWER